MSSVIVCPPGVDAVGFQPGDFLLCRDRGQDWLTELIQAGERARFGDCDLARWDHSALIVSAAGGTVEAEAEGMVRRNLSDHRGEDYVVVHVSASAEQRVLACGFAVNQLGRKYGILNFVGLAVQALTGWNLDVHMDAQFICSGLVSRATEKYVASYPRSSDSMLPADLALFWGVESGEGLVPLSWFARFLDGLRSVSRAIF